MQQTKGQGTELQQFDAGSPMAQDLMMKMEANPVPGQSLTQDPDNKAPWETPPDIVEIEDFVQEAALDLLNPERIPGLLDTLRKGVPVEYLTETYLKAKVQQGTINPDLMMMAIEPVMWLVIFVATYGGIDPEFAPEINLDDGEEMTENTQGLNKATKALSSGEKAISELPKPDSVPQSLLTQAKAAVDQAQGAY